MRCIELCFHEREGRAADLAVRGLGEAGVTVLRRPVCGARAPAPSAAAQAHILLHSPAIADLPADHPARAQFHQPMTVAPIDGAWPLRSSRPWLILAPLGGRPVGRSTLETTEFWKLAAWAAAQPIASHRDRIVAQRTVFRSLSTLKPSAPVLRRRRPLAERLGLAPLEQISGARDWERAVTPLAVAGTLVVAAVVSALAVDVAARPEAWGAIAQASARHDSTVNAFTN